MGLRRLMWITSGEGSRDAAQPKNIIHPKCPRLVGRLLQLIVGDGEGSVVGEGVGRGIGARLKAGELGQSVPGHGQKKMRRKALRAVRKRNSGNRGKFVPNLYEIGTIFTFS